MGRAAAAGTPGHPLAVILDVDIARKQVAGPEGPRTVIQDLRFTLDDREILALAGPSGCGKTTLLRLIGGLDKAFEGSIRWHTAGPPAIGTVFQEPRLLPWRTVQQNIDLVGPPDPAYGAALLDVLGLRASTGLYPPALSLGMARRVALARAFAVKPEVLLLDEPFVSLDPAMAAQGRSLLLDAWHARRCAALIVTHDLAEAACLADRILLLSSGPAAIVREMVIPAGSRRRGMAEAALVVAALSNTSNPSKPCLAGEGSRA